MKLAYGIPAPRGVQKDWDVTSMTLDSSGNMLRAEGVRADWGDPIKCVAWFDRFERLRLCVAHYANGRAVELRFDANRVRRLTFGNAPTQAGVTRMGGDGEAGSVAEGDSTRSRSDAPDPLTPSNPEIPNG